MKELSQEESNQGYMNYSISGFHAKKNWKNYCKRDFGDKPVADTKTSRRNGLPPTDESVGIRPTIL